jgi:glyoxylase-like metal-dependent hydrolase (beta-lactamase superfamily II)
MEPLYKSRPGGFDIQPASQDEARPINDFIYLSEGLSNSFLVTTGEGRVVVNTGMGFEAPVHKRNYDAVDSSPTRYILLTQGHVDHVGGVDLFREEGTEIVAQAGNPAHQDEDERMMPFRGSRSAFAFIDAIMRSAKYIEDNIEGPVPGQSKPDPTITFDDTYSFELGGLRFELLAVPGGETTESMAIWLPEHKICFAGNMFSALFGHFPNLVTIRGDRYRDPLKFVASLDRVAALESELLLVGHNDPVEGKQLIADELARLRGAVLYVHDAVVDGMNNGKDVHTLMREITLPTELEVGQGYGKVPWSVRAIWENYVGWFHHHSTTELYGIPHWSVNADIVELAGGPNSLAARALEKAEAGEPQQAIHLADIVLSVEADNVAALTASIHAHEHLEADSVNFWESSWLRRQIGSMKERLAKP